jgi:hypothetical protein
VVTALIEVATDRHPINPATAGTLLGELDELIDRRTRPSAGGPLLAFTEALITGLELTDAREHLVAAIGEAAAVRAAITVGNFEMMNRIVDATGVPVPPSMGEVFAELGLAPFTGSR